MNKSSQSNLSSWISTKSKSKKSKIDSLEILTNNHKEVEGQCNKLVRVKSISMLDIGKFLNASISGLSIKEQLLNNPWCPWFFNFILQYNITYLYSNDPSPPNI